jgi:hypothetical protein
MLTIAVIETLMLAPLLIGTVCLRLVSAGSVGQQ